MSFSKPRDLTEGSVSRTLIAFAIPILVGNVMQTVNVSINSIWVGRYLGEAALTATSIANSVSFMLLGGIIGVAIAATVLVGQYFGAKRIAEAQHVVGTTATFITAIAVMIALFGSIFCEPLLRGLDTPADAFEPAVQYMRVIFIGMPFGYFLAFLMSVLRGAGDAKTPVLFLAVSIVLDIALNPLLIFGWGPVPALGIAGSAWASVIASAVATVSLVAYLYRTGNALCLRGADLKHLWPDPTIVTTLLRKGIPMGLQMIVISVSAVLMITLVNRYGTDTVAAYGAAMQLWNYIQMPAFAIGMAVSAMAAQNIGAERWDRVSRVAKVGVVYNFLLTGVLVLLVELASGHALGVFLPRGSAALGIAEHINLIVAWSFIFFGVTFVIFGVVRSTGAVIVPLAILFVSLIAVRYGAAWLGVDRFESDAIWWSFTVSSVVAVVLSLVYYKFGAWRSSRMTPLAAPRT